MTDLDEQAIEAAAKAVDTYAAEMGRYGGIAAASGIGIARTAVAAYQAARGPCQRCGGSRIVSEPVEGVETPLGSTCPDCPPEKRFLLVRTDDRVLVCDAADWGSIGMPVGYQCQAIAVGEPTPTDAATWPRGSSTPEQPRPEHMCVCGHTDHWHGDVPGLHEMRPGAGRCEHSAECDCQEFREHVSTPGQPDGEKITHGRHCVCSACAAQDWAELQLAPCGMHGPSCPPVYAPLGAAGDSVAEQVSAPASRMGADHDCWDWEKDHDGVWVCPICGRHPGDDLEDRDDVPADFRAEMRLALDEALHSAVPAPAESTEARIAELEADVARLRARTHEIAESKDAEHAAAMREYGRLRSAIDAAIERTRDWEPNAVTRGAQWAAYPGSWWHTASHNSCMDVAALIAERDAALSESPVAGESASIQHIAAMAIRRGDLLIEAERPLARVVHRRAEADVLVWRDGDEEEDPWDAFPQGKMVTIYRPGSASPVPVAEATPGYKGCEHDNTLMQGECDCPAVPDSMARLRHSLDHIPAEATGELEHLRRIADAAWQARRVLNLNIASISPTDSTAAKNLADLLNDLSDVMPLSPPQTTEKPTP
jgi:hypothetical protein